MMELDESSFTCTVLGTRRIWEPISINLLDDTGSPTPADITWLFVVDGNMVAADIVKGDDFVPGIEHLGQKMRVSVIPKIGNYGGKPIIKEAGIVKPPEEFASLVQLRLAGQPLGCLVEGKQEPCQITFKGPIVHIKTIEDQSVATFDLRTLHSLISENENSLRVKEELSGQEVVLLHFGERRTRDLAHIKLGTWMSYLESLKTNKVFDPIRHLHNCSYMSPDALINSDDNFMTYFYLYRGKLKHKMLLRLAYDKEKKLEEKLAQAAQSRAREAEVLGKLREENTEVDEIKKEFMNLKDVVKALEQERYFLLQELAAAGTDRPRTSSAPTFTLQEEAIDADREAQALQIKDLEMEIDDLKRKIINLEDDGIQKAAEVKVARRMLEQARRELNDTSPLDVTMQTEVHVKLVRTQLENEEYRDKLHRLEFTCKNLQKQLRESKSIVDVLSPSQSSTSNFDIANKLVNAFESYQKYCWLNKYRPH